MLDLKNLSVLAVALLSACISHAQALDCRKVWGDASVENKKSVCSVQIKRSRQAQLIELMTFPSELSPQELVRLQLRLPKVGSLAGAEFRLYNKNNPAIYSAYKISLYADEQFNWLVGQRWNEVTFSPSLLVPVGRAQQPLTTLGLFIVAQPNHDVDLQLRTVTRTAKDNSQKGFVSITFDDGFSSVKEADRLLEKYQLQATAYLIREALGKPGYLTLEESCALAQSRWAVGSHAKEPFVDQKNLNSFLSRDKAWMSQQCSQRFVPQHVAYPLGKINDSVLKIAAQHYKTGRVAGGGVETLPPADPLRLRAVNVTPAMTPEEIETLALHAVKNGDWLILMFHHLVTTPQNDLEYSLTQFEKMAQKLATLRSQVKKISDVRWSQSITNPIQKNK